MRWNRRTGWTGLAVLLVAAGCAAAVGTGSGGDRSVISQEEIEASHQTNAYDLVRAERPNWLRVRGGSFSGQPRIPVYVDGLRLGDRAEALRQISVSDIQEIRYYDAREAQFKYGTGNAHGAIEIVTRQR